MTRSIASLGVSFAAALLGGSVLLLACSDDDPPPAGGSSSSSGGTSGTSGTTGTTSGGTSGTTSGGTSGGGTSGGTSGGQQEAGSNLENGATCSGDETGNGECKSARCKSQGGGGGGGGKQGNFCTIACTMNNAPDPTCTGPAFTGQCRGTGFCQVK
jgi:hypothetical protein